MTTEADFVAAMLDAARQAEAAGEVTVQRLEIAGVRIDIRYGGRTLHDAISPALAHLEVGSGEPEVVIRAWDTPSTGVAVPPSPVESTRLTFRGDIAGFDDPRYRTAFQWSEYSISAFDVAAGEASYWVADPAKLPYWSKSSPMRTMLGWVLAEHGVQLLHAAAVGTEHGAVVISGPGGTGKSTTSLTALEAGLDYLGDDYVAVTLDPPTVHSLYATAKIADLQHPAAQRYPKVPPSPGDEKGVLQLHPEASALLRRSAPLLAVLTPEIADQEHSEVVGVDRARVEQAVAFTTLAQLPHAGREARERMRRLLDTVPAGLLRLGRDRASVADAIREVIRDPAASATPPQTDDLPFVSVVVPVRNGAHFLPKAIESIVLQSYPHLEIVLVDDGSQDAVLTALEDLPIDLRVRQQEPAGPATARNTGIEMATGDLIAFLDIDDRWPPGALHALVAEWMREPAPVVIGRGEIVELDLDDWSERAMPTADVYPWYIASAIFERGIFDRVGLFDPEMVYGEDTDWFRRFEEAGESFRRIEQTTLVVRRHGGNMTEGRNLVELYVVRAVKKALDRKRARERDQDA